MSDGDPTVGEYMTRDVETVRVDATVGVVARRIAESDGHSGFPVCHDRRVVGFVAATDLLAEPDSRPITEVMSDDLLVARPDMAVDDAARVILRSGIQKLPVVDSDDNLEGRQYELERGLAEPLVVIDNGGDLLLADGHHRVKAADRLDVDRMDAYVIVLDEVVDLGMATTARKEGLASIDDIDVVDYAHHPLVEKTQQVGDNRQ